MVVVDQQRMFEQQTAEALAFCEFLGKPAVFVLSKQDLVPRAQIIENQLMLQFKLKKIVDERRS